MFVTNCVLVRARLSVELKELVGMHGVAGCDDPTQTNREMLSEDEIKIIKGALDMRDKKAGCTSQCQRERHCSECRG